MNKVRVAIQILLLLCACSFATSALTSNLYYGISRGRGYVTGEGNGATNVDSTVAGQKVITTANTTGRVVGQLVAIYSANKAKYTSAIVDTVHTNVSIVLDRALPFGVGAGNNVTAWWTNSTHPTTFAYRFIADSAYYALVSAHPDINNGVHVLYGDSWIADGTLATQLASRLTSETSVLNKGFVGAKIADLNTRFADSVSSTGANYVWVLVGTNDWNTGTTLEAFENGCRSLVNKILSIGATPIFWNSSVAPYGGSSEALAKLYADSVDYISDTVVYQGSYCELASGLRPQDGVVVDDSVSAHNYSSGFFTSKSLTILGMTPTLGVASSEQSVKVFSGNSNLSVPVCSLYNSTHRYALASVSHSVDTAYCTRPTIAVGWYTVKVINADLQTATKDSAFLAYGIGNRYWLGASTAFASASNWGIDSAGLGGASIPDSLDTVRIVGTGSACITSENHTIAKLVHTGGTLNTSGDTLTIKGNATWGASATHTTDASTLYRIADGATVTTAGKAMPRINALGSISLYCGSAARDTVGKLVFMSGTGDDTLKMESGKSFVYTSLDSADWSSPLATAVGRNKIISSVLDTLCTSRATVDIPATVGFKNLYMRNIATAATDTIRCLSGCRSGGGNYACP